MASIYIPVQGTEEEVRVQVDQLPADAADILDILKAEQAPLHLWLTIAREYFKQGKIEQFRQILEEGSSSEIDEYYADVKYDRIAILNALGAYYTSMGKAERGARREECFNLATQYYNRASKIDEHEPTTWLGKGQLSVAKGELQMAYHSFSIVLDMDSNNFAALLGQANVHYNMADKEQDRKAAIARFKLSLEDFRKAIRIFPNCPGHVRLGLGYCFFRLDQPDKARKAFQRVLQLEPDNVDALVALGIMDIQTNDAAGIRKGMERMRQAFEIYPYCPMALNHLANHYFFTGQHFLVEQLTETVLCATNHPMVKAHAYYNLARSYHSKGDFEKAGHYYRASVKEISKPDDFILPYYGLAQIQMKNGEYKSSLMNFEKLLEVHPDNCESIKAVGHIYSQTGGNEKAIESFRKATRIDPKDHQGFLELAELLVNSDCSAALEAYKTALNLLRKGGEDVPLALLNFIGILHFNNGDFEMAEKHYKEAAGDGIWTLFLEGKMDISDIDGGTFYLQYRDQSLFQKLDEAMPLELPSEKVAVLFNYGRLLEELHENVKASLLYRLILFKYPDYIDAYLRLATLAKARNDIPLSIELINDALKVDDKNPNVLSMLGAVELADDWIKAKDRFRAVKDATDGKDSYAAIQLGNWNIFAAMRPEKKGPKAEVTHFEKAKELYANVLKEHKSNIYAANGIGILQAEKGRFEVAKDIFTQVHEAASGSANIQMPDAWINLAHTQFALGQFPTAVKMYQNCLRKFHSNTDSQILLYSARTHYEAEQWQECKKALLRAIHLNPSNYTLRFNLGVSLQKSSASTLQKTKRTAEEVRSTVTELNNAIRVFSMLSVASTHHVYGFDERKTDTHVEYCKHLLDAAKIHCEAAERDELQNRQKLEMARHQAMAEEARRKAEEQKKLQLERIKQEDELKKLMQQEEQFERIKEQWKSSSNAQGSRRRDKTKQEAGDGQQGERRRRKVAVGGKRRRKDQKESTVEEDEPGRASEPEGADEDNVNTLRDFEDDMAEAPQDHLAAAGLEDSDAEDEKVAFHHRRRAWSESEEEDEPAKLSPQASPSGFGNHSGGSDDNDGRIQRSADATDDDDK